MDNKYDVSDLVAFAVEQKPLEFEQTFSDLVLDRVRGGVEAKTQQVATQMYGSGAVSINSGTEE